MNRKSWELLAGLDDLPGGRRTASLMTGPPHRSGQQRYRSDRPATALYSAENALREEIGFRPLAGQEVQAFTASVLARSWPHYPHSSWPLRVAVVPGTRLSFYLSGTMTVSSPVDETTVLHELAHHFSPYASAVTGDFHDREFMAAYLDLLTVVLGPEAAAVLADLITAPTG